MRYKEIAGRYKALMNDGYNDEAVAFILLIFSQKVAVMLKSLDREEQLRAYEIVNKRANNFIVKYKLKSIPKDFVLTFIRDKGENVTEEIKDDRRVEECNQDNC